MEFEIKEVVHTGGKEVSLYKEGSYVGGVYFYAHSYLTEDEMKNYVLKHFEEQINATSR